MPFTSLRALGKLGKSRDVPGASEQRRAAPGTARETPWRAMAPRIEFAIPVKGQEPEASCLPPGAGSVLI
jgi:hypothetical protein